MPRCIFKWRSEVEILRSHATVIVGSPAEIEHICAYERWDNGEIYMILSHRKQKILTAFFGMEKSKVNHNQKVS